MAVMIQTVRLKDEQLTQVAEVLARAFFDDPLFTWVFPDEHERTRILPAVMGVGVRIGHLYGEVYTSDGTVEGGAVWQTPDTGELTPERIAATGYPEVAAQLSEQSGTRFGTAMGAFDTLRKRDVPRRHWYLNILGVEPARQGMGIGGQLIQPVLARADAERLPCYLETLKPRNLPFYRKHGFEVVVEDLLPAGPRFWTMLHEPRG